MYNNDKFIHSVKVPRLYKVASTIAKQYSEGVGSIKHLVYGGKKKHPNLKAIFALVTTLYDKSEEIENLLKRSKILEKETRLDPWLTKILIVELLWGKGALVGESKPENTVRGYEQIFKAHLTDKPTKKTEGPLKPRYVRVNTLSLITDEAIQNFQDEGWELSKFFDKNDYEGFLQKISKLEENEFMVDIHIPDLLIFPAKTEFHNHPAYNKASILLQDKASCLPVHILAPPPGSTVLDMCAAPGMKTTHLAALLKNQGTVYAVEKDPKRYQTLEDMVADSGATCVKTLNKDVLDCGPEDFPGVEYILVDPSCTGSGIADRYYSNEKIDPDRVQKLAGFQIKILRTALKKYPNAKRVVYSTCSILPEENEDVVRQVIETNYNFKLVPAKQFVSGTWKNFGSPDYGELGAHCLYTKPDDDFTNGFFVAVFERMAEGEENKFFNNKIYSYKRKIDKKERRIARKLERERRQNEENGDCEEFNNENTELEHLNPEDINNINEQEENSSEAVKKKKKKKKHPESNQGITNINPEASQVMSDSRSGSAEDGLTKSKKKRILTEGVELDARMEIIEELPRKKKKKQKDSDGFINNGDAFINVEESKKIEQRVPNNSEELFGRADLLNNQEPCKVDEKTLKKKRKKKGNNNEIILIEDSFNESQIEEETKSIKKKCQEEPVVIDDSLNDSQIEEKIKSKKKHQEEAYVIRDSDDDIETKQKNKSKKKKQQEEEKLSYIFEANDMANNSEIRETELISKKKKKKKKKNKDREVLDDEDESCGLNIPINHEKTKNKKKNKNKEEII